VPNLYPDVLTKLPILEGLAPSLYTMHESGDTKNPVNWNEKILGTLSEQLDRLQTHNIHLRQAKLEILLK